MNNQIEQAVVLLRQGKVVAIPTETVYGLAADASNAKAVEKIFKIKGRPIGHPVIVHIADSSQLSQWAIDIPQDAYKLTKAFWPGPLTLILKKARFVPDIVTGSQDTVGIRCPSHPITQAILKEFGGGLAAPSANRFGRISPTSAQAVKEELGDNVDFIVDGGPCEVGVESTILDLTGKNPRLLRPGMISHQDIEKVLHKPVELGGKKIPRVSGALPKHYAPETPVVLISSDNLSHFVRNQLHKKKSLAVLSLQALPFIFKKLSENQLIWHTLPEDAKNYAQKLYEKMRALDYLNRDLMVIEKVPETAEWLAISDRLKRAAHTGAP
ncbi:MAG: threonylcarbamoyl-AMP synthase [Gammaproteobacteria bacterium]|nr:threonylcarbamoyl-AMP synthase [Gammaproteobacteria bacterium]